MARAFSALAGRRLGPEEGAMEQGSLLALSDHICELGGGSGS